MTKDKNSKVEPKDVKTEIVEMKVGQALDVWAKPEVIRKLFAPTLTPDEFLFFMGIGKSTGANPFKREIFAVKYGDNPAVTILARDYDRKMAQRQPDYDHHYADAVYSKDEWKYDQNENNGVPIHKPDVTKDRGELMGAFGLAWKIGKKRPYYIFCNFTEYIQTKKDGSPNKFWKSAESGGQPETQIKKVAEAQVLRMAWQEAFSGTLSEAEVGKIAADHEEEIEGEIIEETPPVEVDEKEPTKTIYANKLFTAVFEKCEHDEAATMKEIERLTEYESDGKKHAGITDISKLTEQRAMIAWGKFKNEQARGSEPGPETKRTLFKNDRK